VPVTTSFRIIIKTSIDIGVKDSMVCGNRSQPLYLRAGGGQGGVRWYTLPGGDPALSCTQCDVVWVSPDSTTYYVAEMSIGSCIFRDTLKMTVTPLPTVDTIQANPTGAGSFSFSSNARNMATYTWNFGNGGLATVANPTYTYYQNGSYNVRLVVSNFCGQDTAYKTVNVKGVSVNNVPGQNTELKVYPNPADRSVHIQGTSPIECVKVYDIKGVLVNEYRYASKTSVEIDVKSYPQGLYLLRIETTDGVVTHRIEVLR
jgi:hypothetical protein